MWLIDRHWALPRVRPAHEVRWEAASQSERGRGVLSALYSSAGRDVFGADLSINDEASLTAAFG